MKCIATGMKATEHHHIYTQKAYPEHKDKLWNKAPVCRLIHQEWHQCGTKHMANKYMGVKVFLYNNEWTYDETKEKYFHAHV